MGLVNKFFNTGQICTKQVTSLESWILSEGRPAMGILSAGYIFFFGVSCNFYFSHCFISWFLFCVARACFFFLVLLSTSSSFSFFVFFFLVLLSFSSFLFCEGLFLLSWILSGDFLFNKRASVTSFAGYYYKIFPLHEYFVTWWVFSVPFLNFFLSFCFLIFFLAV